MKFKTSDLLGRIDALITLREQSNAQATAKRDQQIAEHREKWLETKMDGWAEFSATLRRRIRANQPITLKDFPESICTDRFHPVDLYQPLVPQVGLAEVDSLKQLKLILESSGDEFVTTTGLREIGFKDIARLFRGVSA